MEFRRFGKTEKEISVITLGGMRYKHGWDDPRDFIPKDSLEQAIEVTNLAFKHGINHIETAYGYKKSEHLYGKILNEELKIPRNSYFLMTKGAPKTASETRELVEQQLNALQTDYVDFYGWHGINNWHQFNIATHAGGPVDELIKLKSEGLIKHIGFSTHAPIEIIIKTIETDLFDFINLHYYYFFQRNYGAIALAQSKDMGVFIISPNDKGGKLYSPSNKLKNLTSPYSPIQWNAKFCLQDPAIHTLSFGLTEPEHFDELPGIFPVSVPLSAEQQKIKYLLDQQLLSDPYSGYPGYEFNNDRSGLNIPEILRLRKIWKCYDMHEFASYRYNMFQPEHHWFPGDFPNDENLALIDQSMIPKGIPLLEMIKETHEALYKPKKVVEQAKPSGKFKPVKIAGG